MRTHAPPKARYIADDADAQATVRRRAANLRALRVSIGLASGETATKAGLKSTYLVELESGAKPISIRSIDRLAAVFAMTPAAVLGALDDGVTEDQKRRFRGERATGT